MAGPVHPYMDSMQHIPGSSENSLQQPTGCKLLIKIMLKLSRQQNFCQNAEGPVNKLRRLCWVRCSCPFSSPACYFPYL